MKYLVIIVCVFFWSCGTNGQIGKTEKSPKEHKAQTPITITIPEIEPITKSVAEWKKQLTDKEFYVLREAGTEYAHSGDLLKNKERGVYTCAGCQLPLFASDTKYKSGTGWPSFYEPIDKTVVEEDTDYHLGYARTEVHCARCKGHLGHVFSDGPKPTGLRYCMNSVSMDFVAAEELDELESNK